MVSFLNHIASILYVRGLTCGAVYPLYYWYFRYIIIVLGIKRIKIRKIIPSSSRPGRIPRNLSPVPILLIWRWPPTLPASIPTHICDTRCIQSFTPFPQGGELWPAPEGKGWLDQVKQWQLLYQSKSVPREVTFSYDIYHHTPNQVPS